MSGLEVYTINAYLRWIRAGVVFLIGMSIACLIGWLIGFPLKLLGISQLPDVIMNILFILCGGIAILFVQIRWHWIIRLPSS